MANDSPREYTFEHHPAEFDQALAEAVERLRGSTTFILFTAAPEGPRVIGGTSDGAGPLAVLGYVAVEEVWEIGRRAAEALTQSSYPKLVAAGEKATRDFDRWVCPPMRQRQDNYDRLRAAVVRYVLDAEIGNDIVPIREAMHGVITEIEDGPQHPDPNEQGGTT